MTEEMTDKMTDEFSPEEDDLEAIGEDVNLDLDADLNSDLVDLDADFAATLDPLPFGSLSSLGFLNSPLRRLGLRLLDLMSEK